MRLSEGQLTHIKDVFRIKMGSQGFELYLFGSRVHDHLMGGDIDLLVLSDQRGCDRLHQEKYEILVQIKASPLIGERKIDLIIATPSDLQSEPFLQIISEDKVRIL